MLRLIAWIQSVLTKIRRDHIAAYSGQSAYFLIMSALPFLLFILTMLQYLPIKTETLIEMVSLVMPGDYTPAVETFFNDLHVDAGSTLISFSVIVTIWTAAKGIMAVTDGLNSVQGIEETRNYFFLRLKAACYTFLFALAILFTVVFLVFGNHLYSWIQTIWPNLPDYSQMLKMLKSVIAIFFYISFFTLLYKFLPAKRMKTLRQLPGAVFTATGWIIASYIFSLYVDYAKRPSYLYGSLSYLILFFIFLYFLMYIFFLGAELNFLLSPNKKDHIHLKY